MKVITGIQNSRRLNRSLGVNLFKLKTCNMDCIYCEYGENKIYKQQLAYSYDEIIKELIQARKTYADFDYITFSGLGEPTIHPDFAKVINYVVDHFDAKICVITNSTTIGSSEIQAALHKTDVVIPSLDAISKKRFDQINRPTDNVNLNRILAGLKQFSSSYKGQLFIEIFVSENINDHDQELTLFADYLADLKYSRIDLNSLDRAPAITGLKKISESRLIYIKNFLEAKGIKRINII